MARHPIANLTTSRQCAAVCYRVDPTVQRAMKNRGEQMPDFGCCELRFSTSTLLSVQQKQ